jgi:hypothetical protein
MSGDAIGPRGITGPVEMRVQIDMGVVGRGGHFRAAINVSTAAGVNGLPATLS